jgi:hypothetical protein
LGCESGAVEPLARARELGAEPPLVRIRAMPSIDGRGAHLMRVFPSPVLAHLDPFVLLDDFDVAAPAGFPTHPHRGFEAFTYMLEGAFHHVDNLGNDSVVTAGGTQRFTSGSGAWHSEMPGTDGRNHGLQLWVNLPRRLKQMSPNYAGLEASHHAVAGDDGARVRSIVGQGSDAELQTPVRYRDVTLAKGHSFRDVVQGGWNALVYVIEGSVALAGETVGQYEAVLPREGPMTAVARSAARLVFLAGKPLGEPIYHHGPFVD